MDILKELLKYLKLNFLFTKITNPNEITEPIVEEIRKAKSEPLNTGAITTPLLQGLSEVNRSIKEIPQPEATVIPEFPDLSPLFSKLENVFKEEIKKLDREVVVKNDISKLFGIFKTSQDRKEIVGALKNIEDKIPSIKENPDYSPLLLEIISKLANFPAVDLSKVEELLKNLDKESLQLPEYFKLDKNQLAQLIPISMMHTKALNKAGAQVNPATEEKQDALIAKDFATSAKQNTQTVTIQDLDNKLSFIGDRLEYGMITDSAKRLKINIEAGTLPTVTTVGTVSLLTNQVRIGDVQAQRMVEANLDTAFNLGIINHITF